MTIRPIKAQAQNFKEQQERHRKMPSLYALQESSRASA